MISGIPNVWSECKWVKKIWSISPTLILACDSLIAEPLPLSNNNFYSPAATNIYWLNLLMSGLGVPDPNIVTLIISANETETYARSIGIKKNLIV